MSNDKERNELLQQIENLLAAVESVQACLESRDATLVDGRLDTARADLRNVADGAMQVVSNHRAAQQEDKQTARKKVTLATSLQAGAEAAEWQANKLKANGDEAGARLASEHAATLRRMAAEAAVTERRQSFHLVPAGDSGEKQ